MKTTVTLHSPDYSQAWKCRLSRRSFSAVDNGRAISCGLMLGEDVQPATLKAWIARGIAQPMDAEKAKHSGCLSRCILRGDSYCQW